VYYRPTNKGFGSGDSTFQSLEQTVTSLLRLATCVFDFVENVLLRRFRFIPLNNDLIIESVRSHLFDMWNANKVLFDLVCIALGIQPKDSVFSSAHMENVSLVAVSTRLKVYKCFDLTRLRRWFKYIARITDGTRATRLGAIES
jgi:hypothetical protein